MGTKIIIPEAIIKNKFLKVNPPPDLINAEHKQIHKRAINPKPIAFPIPIKDSMEND